MAGTKDGTTVDLTVWRLAGHLVHSKAARWAVWRAHPRAGLRAEQRAAPTAGLWGAH